MEMFLLGENAIIIIIIFDIAFALVYGYGWSSSCPNCHKYFARKLIGKTNFGTNTIYKNSKQTKVHKDTEGKVVGTTTINVTKPVTVRTQQNHYHCKKCGNTWSGGIHEVEVR